MKESKWMGLLALLLALAMVAAACGSDGDDSAVSDGGADTAKAVDDSTDEADEGDSLGNVEVDEEAASCATAIELDRGAYAPQGDLQNAIAVRLRTLNPHDDQGPANFAYYGWVYEGLVRQDVDGTVVPWLAKCWETNEAGDQMTFFLHEGVTFHDGAPFNAEAVKANIDFIKTAGPPEVIPPIAGQMALVDNVEIIDELTVRFNLSAPASALILSGLIRNSGFMVSPNALGNSGANPIGTAPYRVTSTSADLTEINLAAYQDYWQPGLVGLETATITSTGDLQANFDGLMAGQFDVAVINNNVAAEAPAVAQNTTVRIGWVVADWTGQQVPALAEKDVRCAVAGALNREGIQSAGGNPPESAIKQFAVGPDDYGYIDDLSSPDFDLEVAQALLDSTGAGGFTFKNGHIAGGFWPVHASAFATALAELGITMENEALDPSGAAEMYGRLAKGVYPIQIVAYNEPNALMSLIARTGGAAFNPSGVSPDGVDELVAAAMGKSFEEGEADVAAAWKIMIEECIFIINNVLTTTVGYDPSDVSGVVHTQGIPISYWPHGVTKTN